MEMPKILFFEIWGAGGGGAGNIGCMNTSVFDPIQQQIISFGNGVGAGSGAYIKASVPTIKNDEFLSFEITVGAGGSGGRWDSCNETGKNGGHSSVVDNSDFLSVNLTAGGGYGGLNNLYNSYTVPNFIKNDTYSKGGIIYSLIGSKNHLTSIGNNGTTIHPYNGWMSVNTPPFAIGGTGGAAPYGRNWWTGWFLF